MANFSPLSAARAAPHHILMDYPVAFKGAVERVLADEGGYVANPADPGGETNFGISQREYPDLDIRNLTRDQAIEIYYRDWWNKFRFGELPAAVAAKVFDLAVNMGPAEAVRCLQRALRACCFVYIGEDGNLGPLTVKASEMLEGAVEMKARGVPTPLLASLRSEAAGCYRAMAIHRHLDEEFLKGWLNRAYR